MANVSRDNDLSFWDVLKLCGLVSAVGVTSAGSLGVLLMFARQEDAKLEANRKKELRIEAAKAAAARQAKHDSTVLYYDALRAQSDFAERMLPERGHAPK